MCPDRNIWATPPTCSRTSLARYQFTVDACADASNAKLLRYWTKEQGGLIQPWAGERLFIPPDGVKAFSPNERTLVLRIGRF